ncbi:hypothetical protein [Deinococcus frigens]|uniref:hypothetical protein n=1 Tax=Deinococcus frigens TaxID=249403 RepID=UPI000494F843|nr:hypothetical protein [Deinococcus frigens]
MTRAPLKLSREMKLLLLLLLLVALLGAWYVWTNNRSVAALATSGAAPSSAGTGETGREAGAFPSTGDTAPDPDPGAGTVPSGTVPSGTVPSSTVPSGSTSASSDGAASGTPTTGDSRTEPGSAAADGAGTGTAATATAETGPSATGTAGAGLAAGAGTGQDTVPLTPDAPLSGVSGPNGTATGNAGNAGALAVQPNRPVDIEVIPPFPTPEVPSRQGSAATPAGINPQASVASVPRNNPFRPLSLDRSSVQDRSAAASTSGLTGSGSPSNTQSNTQFGFQASTPGGSVQTTPITPSNAAPLAISPVPGAGSSTGVSSGSLSGLPTLPGADSTGLGNPSGGRSGAGLDSPGSGVTSGNAIPGGSGNTVDDSTGVGNTVSGNTVSGSAPGRTISGTSGDSGVTVLGGSGTTGSSTAASRNPSGIGNPAQTNTQPTALASPQGGVVITAPEPPKPIVPPIAGMNVPSVTRVSVTPSGAAPGTANGAGSRIGSDTMATATPVPGTPQVIASLGQGAGAGDGAQAAASQLDQFVQKRQLVFNAAVLGPINTAIFRGQDGYAVVAVGQTLPDSQVRVREVNATTAVLSLGNDLKILELDQR